jgi:hypothetical protein
MQVAAAGKAGMKKQPWDQVKLRVLWHEGGMPEAGDELHTATGRRYLILNCTEKQIKALVLPKDEPMTEGRVFRWTWGKRNNR